MNKLYTSQEFESTPPHVFVLGHTRFSFYVVIDIIQMEERHNIQKPIPGHECCEEQSL